MDPDSLERRKSPSDSPIDESLGPINFKRHYRSQNRSNSSKIDLSRSDSRSELRWHQTSNDLPHEKDFIEWTPNKHYDDDIQVIMYLQLSII